MKIALVHDFLTNFGGAERVLKNISDIFPQAPIFCLLYDNKKLPQFKDKRIIESSLSKYPNFIKKREVLLRPKAPKAIEEFDLSKFDVAISNTNSFAKGVITSPQTLHISYIHSPTRYLWDYKDKYLTGHNAKGLKRYFLEKLFLKMRIWDYEAGQRPDYIIANSKNVARRIKKYYRRKSKVIYPGVDLHKYSLLGHSVLVRRSQICLSEPDLASTGPRKNTESIDLSRVATRDPRWTLPRATTRGWNDIRGGNGSQDFYLIVSRLSKYKKVDLAIRACNKLKKKLIIIGAGSNKKYLESIAGPTIEFKGFLSDKEVSNYYKNARAFLFPAEEDFGLTPIEAMASGTPVIAYQRGGLLETVQEGLSGIFFEKQTVDGLCRAITKFETMPFDSIQIKNSVAKFSLDNFKNRFEKYVWQKYYHFKKKCGYRPKAWLTAASADRPILTNKEINPGRDAGKTNQHHR